MLRIIAGAAALSLVAALPAAAFEEAGTKRWGADYAQFNAASSAECRSACEADEQCRAWTFVKPGTIQKSGRCQLKSEVPFASLDQCCISGIPTGASIGLMAGPGKPDEGVALAGAPGMAEGEGTTAAIARPEATSPPIDIKPRLKPGPRE